MHDLHHTVRLYNMFTERIKGVSCLFFFKLSLEGLKILVEEKRAKIRFPPMGRTN